MNHVIIIGKSLNIFEDLSDFFENRNLNQNTIFVDTEKEQKSLVWCKKKHI